MAGSPKQDKPSAQGVAGRRSTRLSISIPVTISGKDALGHPFKENTRTLIINRQGAKLATVHHLALGGEVSVENRALGQSAKGNVVWLGEKKSPKEPYEIGIQLTEAGNIWGIEFPPDDWQEGPPIGTGGQKLERVAGAQAEPKVAEPAPPPPSAPLSAPKAAIPAPPKAPEAAPAAGGTVAPLKGASLPPEHAGPLVDATLARFTRSAEDAAEAQVKIFEEKLAKLSGKVGLQAQVSLQEAAKGLEERLVGSLEQKLGKLADRLQASRTEIETLLTRFEELQQSGESEVEKTKRNIQNAGFEALQSAVEEVNEKLRKELEALSSDLADRTRKRVEEEGTARVETFSKEASIRLAALADQYLTQVAPEVQARQAQAIDQAKAEITQAGEALVGEFRKKLKENDALEGLQRKADTLVDSFQANLQKSVHKFQEKAAKDVTDHLRETAEKLMESLAKQIQKRGNESLAGLSEELKTSGKALTDEAKKRIVTLTNTTVESLNKEAVAGVEEFRRQLDKGLQEFQEKSTRQIEAHLQSVVEQRRESIVQQLQKEMDESSERAAAEIKTRTEQVVQEVADTVNKHVGSGAVFLRELEDEARARLQTHHQKLEVSAKATIESFQAQLTEKQERAVNAAADAIRSKMSEIFGAVIQTSAKKTPESDPSETEETKKRR